MSLGGVDITTSTVTSEAGYVVRPDTNLFLANVNAPLSTGPAIDQIQMLLDSTNPFAISSDALPTSLNLADFNGNTTMAFTTGFIPAAFVFAEIETLILIPEPGTGVSLGLGVAVACRRRRHARMVSR